MTVIPLYSETIPLKVSAFEGLDTKAAIDSGCSLTKMVFLPRDDANSDDGFYRMRCLTFRNDDFESALKVMKQQAVLPESGKLHMTGVGCDVNRSMIKSILGLEPVYIHEFGTIGPGVPILINNSKVEDIFHPPFNTEENPVESKEMDEISAELDTKLQLSDHMLPAIVVYVGSGGGTIFVTKTGKMKFLGGISLSGRPFLGLSKVLLGTNNYDEVCELASRGDRTKVDLLVKDVLKNNPNSPYGKLPPEVPLSPFGKAAERGWTREENTKADAALSLMSFAVKQMEISAYGVAMWMNVKNIYFGGNFFRAKIVRKLLQQTMQEKIKHFGLNVRCVKTGHTGAIATMLLNEEKAKDAMHLDMENLVPQA